MVFNKEQNGVVQQSIESAFVINFGMFIWKKKIKVYIKPWVFENAFVINFGMFIWKKKIKVYIKPWVFENAFVINFGMFIWKKYKSIHQTLSI